MKVFLDLGTHYGEGLHEFISKYNINESWCVHTFEANPKTYHEFLSKYKKYSWVNSHNKAIGTKNDKILMNIETLPDGVETGEGSSIVDIEKWNPWNLRERGAFKKQVKVECIDFSEFIKNNFSIEDNILCKMDIEGAEYDVLEKMIKDETINYIKEIVVEWHYNFFDNQNEMLNRQIKIQNILSERKIVSSNWK